LFDISVFHLLIFLVCATRFKALTAPDNADVDRVGVTKKLAVRFQDRSQADAVEREMLRVAGQQPLNIARNAANTAIFATFDSPDIVVKVRVQQKKQAKI
jgi:hypothetical protein